MLLRIVQSSMNILCSEIRSCQVTNKQNNSPPQIGISFIYMDVFGMEMRAARFCAD